MKVIAMLCHGSCPITNIWVLTMPIFKRFCSYAAFTIRFSSPSCLDPLILSPILSFVTSGMPILFGKELSAVLDFHPSCIVSLDVC